MAKSTLTNVRFFAGGADLTGFSNKVEVSAEAEEVDMTCFPTDDNVALVWQEVAQGITKGSVSAEGRWSAGDPSQVDDVAWAQLGGNTAWTVCPAKAQVGSVALLAAMMQSSYMLLGEVGSAAPWKAEGKSSGAMARGRILHPPGTPRTATGNGTGVQFVAVPSGGQLYAAVHVLSIAGTGTPTITVKIQNDAANTFSAPTDAITFDPATAAGGQIKRAAGPLAGTWYRATWTITGSTPSFLFVVSLGVG